MPWYELSPELIRFDQEMYAARLVRSIDWMRWAGTPEARRLIDDPAAIAEATHDDLIYLLTTIIRGERFSDGNIAGAFRRGTLLAIAERARALLHDAQTTTTFYRLESGGIARWTETPTSSSLEQWDFGKHVWVDAPYLLGKIVGIGGDGHATEITRDEARDEIGRSPT